MNSNLVLNFSKPLNNQIIHDESISSSTISSDISLDKQFEISEGEFKRKWYWLIRASKGRRVICPNGDRELDKSLGSVFASATRNSTESNTALLEVVFFTSEGAGLTVNLKAHGYGQYKKYYFGTRGSPTKLLSGQNLVELKEHEAVDQIAKRYKCSQFEARSICGFLMINKAMNEQYGKLAGFGSREGIEGKFFTVSELKKLRLRQISVYSIGYATYENFGKDRDHILNMLINLATSEIYLAGSKIKLSWFLGCEAIAFGSTDDKKGWYGKNTGVSLLKSSNGEVLAKQSFYLKKEEVDAKAKTISGSKNAEVMGRIKESDKVALDGSLVRADNVFYREYIAQWLNAVYANEARILNKGKAKDDPTRVVAKKVKHQAVMLADIAPLFARSENLSPLIGSLRNELGVRLLMMSPTIGRIQALTDREDSPLEPRVIELLKQWRVLDSRVVYKNVMTTEDKKLVKTYKIGDGGEQVEVFHPLSSMSLAWDSLKGLTSNDDRKLEELNSKEYLDLSLPFAFYTFLDEIKNQLAVPDMDARLSFAHQLLDYRGEGSKIHLFHKVQKEASLMVANSIRALRAGLQLPAPKSKARVIKEDLNVKPLNPPKK